MGVFKHYYETWKYLEIIVSIYHNGKYTPITWAKYSVKKIKMYVYRKKTLYARMYLCESIYKDVYHQCFSVNCQIMVDFFSLFSLTLGN